MAPPTASSVPPSVPPAVPPPELVDRLVELRQRAARSPGRVVALAIIVVACLVAGWWLVRAPAPPVETQMPTARAAPGGAAADGGASDAGPGGAAGASASSTAATGSTSTSAPAVAVVQAAGAVARPGVYDLPAGARVDDLVRRAGGLAADADADRLNLAAPLADGSRVWVPHRGEGDPPPVVASDDGGGAAATGGAGAPGGSTVPIGPIDLNTATADQLDTLPGVGPATASAILAYRDEHGRFGSVDELLEVRGIGDAKLEQLRSLVAV